MVGSLRRRPADTRSAGVAADAAVITVGVAIGFAVHRPLVALVLALAAGVGFRLGGVGWRETCAVVVAPAALGAGVPWPLAAAPAAVLAALTRGRRPVVPSPISHPCGAVLLGAASLMAVPVAYAVAVPQAQASRAVIVGADPGLLVLVLAVVAFALLNATVEELLWRQLMLGRPRRSGLVPVAVTSLSFGLAHLGGLPGGAVGVGLATAYGVLLGALRLSRGGLGSCIALHVVVDLVIFGVVAGHIVFVPG